VTAPVTGDRWIAFEMTDGARRVVWGQAGQDVAAPAGTVRVAGFGRTEAELVDWQRRNRSRLR